MAHFVFKLLFVLSPQAITWTIKILSYQHGESVNPGGRTIYITKKSFTTGSPCDIMVMGIKGFEVVNFVATTRRWFDRGKDGSKSDLGCFPQICGNMLNPMIQPMIRSRCFARFSCFREMQELRRLPKPFILKRPLCGSIRPFLYLKFTEKPPLSRDRLLSGSCDKGVLIMRSIAHCLTSTVR